MFRIKGGTKQVITALSAAFDHEARVKLGHVVTSVTCEKEEARVTVKTENSSTKVTFALISTPSVRADVRSCDVG